MKTASLLATVLLHALVLSLGLFPGRGVAEDVPGDGSEPVVMDDDLGASGPAGGTETLEEREPVYTQNAYSEEQLAAMKKGEEKHEFQAEVAKLMNIIINSLYTNKDIFLRELISNASDALDKLRFAALTDPSQLGEGDNINLEIRIQYDPEANTISIRDRGVGMTKEDLVDKLGTIARSGTKQFMEEVAKDSTLIGQFGVGFYSSYLVADKVRVISKNNADDKQWVWESLEASEFTVTEDPRGNTLGRGTEIVLSLRDDAYEYMDQDRLRSIVARYSEFIDYPIYLYTRTTEEIEVPIEEEEADQAEDEADKAKDGDVDIEEVEDEDAEAKEDDKPKTRKVEKVTWAWEQLNEQKPIWTRPQDEITDEEYAEFYKSLTKDNEDPLTWSHFSAEGEHMFKSILFIPGHIPQELLHQAPGNKIKALKLYIRRVFITDNFEDMLPEYLNFVRGILDSDDMPVNVSREMLQENHTLKVIKKKVIRKVLEMIKRMANDEENPEKYKTFFDNFGTNLKLGVLQDFANKTKLIKLLRFFSSAMEDGERTSLDGYVERMKEGQEHIYFLGGEDMKKIRDSPVLERLYKRGYEVLYMPEPIDEYTMEAIREYDGHKVLNAAKDDIKFGKETDEKDKEKQDALKEEWEATTKWLKDLFGSKVSSVKLSTRLTTSPCAIVTASYGATANMERILKAQALAAGQPGYSASKIVEINPRHPILKELKAKVDADAIEGSHEVIANLLYETALLTSGFNVEDSAVFANKINQMLALGLDVDPEAVADEEDEADEAPAAGTDDVDAAADVDDAADSLGGDDGDAAADAGVDDTHDEL